MDETQLDSNILQMDGAPAVEEPPPEELFVYQKAKTQLDQIIGQFSEKFRMADLRRKERYVELNVELMRARGVIPKDGTFIPDRVIDGNIGREKSEIVAFLNAGYRLGIFECTSNPDIDTQNLDQQYTKGLTYNGWYEEMESVIDGAMLHGMDYMEVVFDETKPLHVGFEHVGYDRLCFNDKVSNIQDSEFVLRKYEIAIYKLEQEFTEQYGFDMDQVKILTEYKQPTLRNTVQEIWKGYFKYKGIVYVMWFCQTKCNDWLKAPIPLRTGIWESQETTDPITGQVTSTRVESNLISYPIFTNVYKHDENQILVEHKGRGFLDGPQQEANTAIITSYVNQTGRAANIYASPETDDGETSQMAILDIELEPDGIYNRALKFWSMPAPDPMALNALQILDNKNAVQSGQVAFAASNRKDSRKTAKELDIAQQQQSKITSTGLAGFSAFLRNLLEFSWLITRSQAIDNKIKFLLIRQMDQMGKITYVNDIETISQTYDIRPAGDTDVIEAQAEQTKMMQDWPVIQGTPISSLFLQDYIKIRYPKRANVYVAAIQQGNPAKQLVQGLQTVLVGALEHPDHIAKMSPDEINQVKQLEQQAQQFIANPSV